MLGQYIKRGCMNELLKVASKAIFTLYWKPFALA